MMKSRAELIELIEHQEKLLTRLATMIVITRDTAPLLNEALETLTQAEEVLRAERQGVPKGGRKDDPKTE